MDTRRDLDEDKRRGVRIYLGSFSSSFFFFFKLSYNFVIYVEVIRWSDCKIIIIIIMIIIVFNVELINREIEKKKRERKSVRLYGRER